MKLLMITNKINKIMGNNQRKDNEVAKYKND